MVHLSENWFVNDVFDVEYKEYQVLDYVQKTNAHFEQEEFFPYFDHLLKHIHDLELFGQAQYNLDQNLIAGSSQHSFNPLQQPKVHPLGVESELKEIIAFAKNQFTRCRSRAEFNLGNLYNKIRISELGLTNPKVAGGLVLINHFETTRVYTYEHRIIKRPNTFFQYKDVKTCFAEQLYSSATPDFHEIKWQFLKSNKFETGINTYLVEFDQEIPHFETLMPLVKNHLLATSLIWAH